MPRNPDPKHGRWILPLIIVAMVVLTITFVTSLEPAEQEAGTTTTLPPPSTTTTTTLPPDVAAFLVTLDVYENQVTAYQADVAAVNADWEGNQITFAEAQASFQELRAAVAAWEDEVAGAADVPAALAEGQVALVVEAEKLAPAVDDIIAGLEAPDDGTLRRQAVIAFDDQVDAVLAAIDALREEAATTATTVPAEGETTTTTFGEEPTTSITTSTTAPVDTAFQATLDGWETAAMDFRNDVSAINGDWEAREITFEGALAALQDLQADVAAWEGEVAGADDVPLSLTGDHAALVLEVEQLEPAVEAIIAGLEAPDDGTQRRQAVAAFEDQIQVVISAIGAMRS